LAALAAVLAVRALAAGNDNYCNGCMLPSSGIPAVSQAHHYTFDYNELDTYPYEPFQNYFEEVYYYTVSTNTRWCVKEQLGTSVARADGCGTQGNLADARCHLTRGTGPAQADCSRTVSSGRGESLHNRRFDLSSRHARIGDVNGPVGGD
jgi:hypothetical protein